MARTAFGDKEQIVMALCQQQTIRTREGAEAVFEAGAPAIYSAGQRLACQGDQGDCLFYILSGAVRVVINEHEYKLRGKGELVGEMAVIDPGAPRSASLDADVDETTVFQVPTAAFHRVAKGHPALWEGIARVLADRLRQRDEFFVPPNSRPQIFFASSSEGAAVMDKAMVALDNPARQLRPWNGKGIFRPTYDTFGELERVAHEVDFAVIVVTADDIRDSRGAVKLIPRDNVMLEFGLFTGALERARAFLLVQGDPDLELASDVKGITVLYFSNDHELEARIGEISDAVDAQGRFYRLRRRRSA